MVAIGELDRRVTLQVYEAVGQTPHGHNIWDWVDRDEVAAKRTDLTDTEKQSYGINFRESTSRFIIRSTQFTRTLRTSDRLRVGDWIWEIMGIKETRHGRNRFLELTAKRGSLAT